MTAPGPPRARPSRRSWQTRGGGRRSTSPHLQRSAADFDNYRKRVARDAADQAARAGESLVGELLPVLDNLERALDASEHHEEAKVAEGVQLVRQQLVDLLTRRGLEEIDAAPGRSRSTRTCTRRCPTSRRSIRRDRSRPSGSAGTALGNRVVRPARVVVSSGPQVQGAE